MVLSYFTNDLSITNSYNNLGRLLTRSCPDGGVEPFGYTFDVSGPTSYTNQIGDIVLYLYDGNVVIQERDANNLPQVTHTSGNDFLAANFVQNVLTGI